MLREMPRLECAYLVGVHQGLADLVQAFEQGRALVIADLEGRYDAFPGADLPRHQVHGQRVARRGGDRRKEALDHRIGQRDRQQAVLDAVAVEDIRVGRGDQGLETVLLQGPGGMLAARAAAEVVAGEEDRRPSVARPVQDEVRVERTLAVVHPRLAMVQVAQLVEQIGAEAGPPDGLHELLGDDEVRVDVFAVQRGHQAPVRLESLHGGGYSGSFLPMVSGRNHGSSTPST